MEFKKYVAGPAKCPNGYDIKARGEKGYELGEVETCPDTGRTFIRFRCYAEGVVFTDSEAEVRTTMVRWLHWLKGDAQLDQGLCKTKFGLPVAVEDFGSLRPKCNPGTAE